MPCAGRRGRGQEVWARRRAKRGRPPAHLHPEGAGFDLRRAFHHDEGNLLGEIAGNLCEVHAEEGHSVGQLLVAAGDEQVLETLLVAGQAALERQSPPA